MPLGDHTIVLSLEGGLWAFGWNNCGQLGLGHMNDKQLQPAEVIWNGPQPVQVDWGCYHSLVLDAEGGVWEAGRSRSSSLSHTFQRVLELPLIALVAAGKSHSAALDTKGGLWVWTSETSLPWASSLPQRVEGFPPLIKVACGNNFLVAEAEEGLWVLGDNSKGKLGLGHTNNALQPTLIQTTVPLQGSLRCLAALAEGVILIDSQGRVFSSGNNTHGQLGRVSGQYSELQAISYIPPMLAVSCGSIHVLSLDENGGVWTWGHGGDGQLGTGKTRDKLQPSMIPFWKEMSAMVAGGWHSLAFPQEGGLLVFGSNTFGQLGLNHTTKETSLAHCPLQPALPYSFRSRKKSARFP